MQNDRDFADVILFSMKPSQQDAKLKEGNNKHRQHGALVSLLSSLKKGKYDKHQHETGS